jgi:uncharacterized protein YfeS
MLSACETQESAHKATGISKIDTSQQINNMSDYSPTLENAHPNAKGLMNEEFYFSTIEETAPFGSDDGADTYAGFKDWRQANKSDNPKDFLIEQIDRWAYPSFDLTETNIEKLKPYLKESELHSRYMSGIDAAIVAIAFGQLYLEGTIDKDFKKIAKTSIERELNPKLLALWGDSYKAVREIQLKKMLAVLNKVE